MNNVLYSGERILTALQNIENNFETAGDRVQTRKMRQLLDKSEAQRMYIAFCGHFSAGKSSMINKLCGHELLPSSPIPTSANIVSIANGKPEARVTHRSSEDGEHDGGGGPQVHSIPLAELDAYCKNGTDIETVEIRYPIDFLGEHAALLDTPGIDSTDDAHHMATESALHLADVVFYVMDYNHVQSEINFAFTKKMKERGKPLYLIINMIDKHREQELSFEEYKESALQAFRNWHIEPDGVFYTSVKQENHPLNDWDRLLWTLKELVGRAPQLTEYSLYSSAVHLVNEHAKAMADRTEAVKSALRDELAEDGAEEAQAEYARLAERLEALKKLPEQMKEAMRKEASGVAENANITPAATRDLAHEYLQSRKPGFKVGFFAGAAKTAKEIERRLEAFHRDFTEKVHTQLEWHLRDALKKQWSAFGFRSDDAAGVAEELQVEVTPEWLAAQVNPAAGFTGEYTLNYSRQIAAEAKTLGRKRAFDAADRLAELAAQLGAPERAALEAQLAALETRLRAVRELERLAGEEAAYRERLLAALAPAPLPPALPDAAGYRAPARAAAAPAPSGAAPAAPAAPARAAAEPAGASAARPAAGALGASRHRERLARAAEQLAAAERAIAGTAALARVARAMRDKAERLRQSRFTIALFGAFSAGKSSFANALIGERVLPVSPNPTTAAINKIMPPDADWPHGSVKVKMKSLEAMTEDILYSLKALGAESPDLTAALAQIGKLSPAHVTAKGKPHFTFLKAVEKGWQAAEPNLGRELRVGLEEFREYVADESKSCFVDVIELYYANPLTEQGIVFVDTPGADSINARHTGVAFNYIKNADAILFVTYYNHAFSQADREFLLQLGRVKDSFEMDKMFFIVNAADLASSQEELDGVVGHVEANLLTHGIRHPRIFPISSQMALEGKLAGDGALAEQSGITAFERDFVKFSLEELTDIAVRSAQQEIKRAADVMGQWIAEARSDAEERQRKAASLRSARQEAERLLRQTDAANDEKELAKEIDELLYYVKQRTSFRFGELFNIAFNPSVFREDRGDVRTLMQTAWDDLTGMIAFDLSQESLATTLRIENKMNELARARYAEWEREIAGRVDAYEADSYESAKFATPELNQKLSADDVSGKWLAGFFKNAKTFFEGDGKAKLKGELEARLTEPINRYAAMQAEALKQAYLSEYRQWFQQLRERHIVSLEEHVEGLTAALEMKLNEQELETRKAELLGLLG
ncbi:dynamin family protein [Paenibacillus hamazuiensis]|uniref:dynamin family protein n=1 Tax=Paenibacillus hamazuiensis TaxID=2936508 RepID=UPI00200EC80A|nr:dynamin family protein [Paenibacillus hamazuiensis]